MSWVPIRIIDHHNIGTRQVQANTSSPGNTSRNKLQNKNKTNNSRFRFIVLIEQNKKLTNISVLLYISNILSPNSQNTKTIKHLLCRYEEEKDIRFVVEISDKFNSR